MERYIPFTTHYYFLGMDRDGHIGFTWLIWFTAAWISGTYSTDIYVLGIIAGVLSFIPDLDIKLRLKHRGITHSLVTATVLSIPIGYLTYEAVGSFWLGFTVVFAAQATHILGDIFTYTPLKPLYPLSNWSISLKLFRSDNKMVNRFFLILGGLASAVYLMKTGGLDIFELLLS